jgi:protein-L-isoaspartate(D-aspartate) O-methyltransferase
VSDDASLTKLRERLVAEVLATSGIRDERIAAALRDVPRHLFLPHLPPEEAYLDDAIVTKRDADGQPMSSSSQPAIMAIMLYQLDLAPGQRVLEIGAGTGYNAALIRHIVGASGTVVSVDIEADLVDRAREHLASAGYPGVTVVAADGAEGYPPGAPYDRVIATVGVSDLAPAWLHQTGPGARIVVPLDVRGSQLAVAFGRAEPAQPGSAGHWVSRSIAPCGFMRMRGSLAGPERIVVLQPGLSVTLPDGLTLADGQEVDGAALAAFLDGPPTEFATGVRASSLQVFWGLGLWLAAGDRRSCGVTEERPSGPGDGAAARLARAPLRGHGVLATAGIVDSGGIAVLTTDQPAVDGRSGQLALQVAGFGPHGPELGTALAAHVQAWDRAGQPGAARLHVDAYPRSSPDDPAASSLASDALLIERPATRFVVYHT